MANVAFHMAAGIALGGALTVVPVARALLAERPMARSVGRLLVFSTLCGVLAIVPNLLQRLGGQTGVYDGWWANVFVLHPTIDRMRDGGMLIGHVSLALFFIGSYLFILRAIAMRQRDNNAGAQPPARPAENTESQQ